MKILHTADWHLGKRLDNFARHEEQLQILEEILTIADTEAADVVILAGDLYDNFNPPLESQSLLYQTLKRLARDGERPVIAIAGNHDSPDRIDSPDPLARECGIIFIGRPLARVPAFEIPGKFAISGTDEGFLELQLPHHPPLRVLHTAFANEHRLKTYLGDDKGTALNSLLQAHWQALADAYCNNQGINILVTHLYMQRSGESLEEPEGEKPLKIGNADIVFTHAIPEQIGYTALGHLHRYHNIGTDDRPVVYPGSPLAYSFSEAGQQKYVVIAEALPAQDITCRKVALTKGKSLFRKTFNDIPACIVWLREHPDCLVELTLHTDTYLTPAEIKQLYEAHSGIVFIIPKITGEPAAAGTMRQLDLSQDVTTLFETYFQQKHGLPPGKELLDIFTEIVHS